MTDAPPLSAYSNGQIARFLRDRPSSERFEPWIRMVREAERERCAVAIECMGAIPLSVRELAAVYLRSLADPLDPVTPEPPHCEIPGVTCTRCQKPAICVVGQDAYCEDCEPSAPAGIRLYEHQLRRH